MAARTPKGAGTRPIPIGKNRRPKENPAPLQRADDNLSVSIQELRFTLLRLRQARCIVSTAVGALIYQNCDADADIASVLKHSLGALLLGEITRFETLLARGFLE